MDDILITGDKGFIGSRLKKFINQNPEKTNIFTLPCKILYENIFILEEYFSSIKKLNYIFHLADLNGNAKWLAKNNYTQFDANTKSFSILLNLIVKFHPNAKLICLGSAWAYPSNKSIVEEIDFGSYPLISGLESYAKAKIYQYDLLNFAKKEKGLNFTFFPTCTIFSSSETSDHLIPTLKKRIKSNPDKIEIYTDGNELRSFLHVDDLVFALYCFKDYSNNIMNISSNQRMTIKQVVESITKSLLFKGEVNYSSKKGLNTPKLSLVLSELEYQWPSKYKLKDLNSIL